jgi:hypothetical protein
VRTCRSCAARETEADFPISLAAFRKAKARCLSCLSETDLDRRVAERRRELDAWHRQGIRRPGRQSDLVVYLETAT